MSTVTLTIDGRRTTVEEGTTVLEAARGLGIQIPTLCHVKGFEPSASCFLCTVQVEGFPRLSPSCALPAADGMVVTTDSDDIRASRKMALELLLSDHAGDCIAPCSAGCPAGLDVSAYVYELASGHVDRAMEVIFDRLSLPGTLGRVCPRLCEQNCKRCDHDGEGLAIAALHRYATDRNQTSPARVEPKPGESTGKSVAIVGAGPAGLTAAFYLRQKGHACTLFDAHPLPGGMLRYGIPEYRLPRPALDDEIRVIERLGATLSHEHALGRRFLARRVARVPRCRLPRHRGAAHPGPALRGRGSRAVGDRVPAQGRRRRRARPGTTRDRHRWRQHGDGRLAHGAASRRRGQGLLPAHAQRDALPARRGRGRRGGGDSIRVPGRAGPTDPRRQRRRAATRLPAHGARRARRVGAAASGADSRTRSSRWTATP